MQDVVYVIDADSGWENDEDILWHIDEGNEADWADAVATVIEDGNRSSTARNK
jgi:hypothetical protein